MGWLEGESDRDRMGNRRLLLGSRREVMKGATEPSIVGKAAKYIKKVDLRPAWM